MWRITPPGAALTALIAAFAFLPGCASPAQKYDAAASTGDVAYTTHQEPRFHHKIYRNMAPLRGKALHVFIEGDVAVKVALANMPPDPTPCRGLMLRLLQRDPDAAILLGRPCYHGTFEMDECDIRHLGRERYSAEIVDGMIGALRAEMRRTGARQAILFGCSGGGTIAMLMAARMPEISAIVTLAGNLDNAALTAHHESPAFTGSLDPADLPQLPRGVLQLHFMGEQDEIIPPVLAHKTLARQGAAPVMLPGADHSCCWEDKWPEILSRLQHDLAGQ